VRGFFGKILCIDLSKGEFDYEDLTHEILETTLGGKGLGSCLLMKDNPAGVDPFSREAVFIIAPGPVTGTKLWGQSRFAVFAKSPATGGYGESYCGGTLAPKIKGCGVDAITLTGKCPSLNYLVIDENGVAFHDAASLRGADTFVAHQYIVEHAPANAGAIVIGPAGERGVAFACLKSDRWRSLGRGGLGAVLGSKNVKGIAFAGTRTCPIADEALMRRVIRAVAEKARTMPVTKVYRNFGTPMQVAVVNENQCFPTRYWQSGYFSKWKNLSAEYMQRHFEVRRHGCPDCFLQCTKLSQVKSGRHKGLRLEGPEFETIYAIGGLNEIESLQEVAWLNDLCDRLGLDTMSAGNIASFAVEAFKAGKLDFEIDYNQPDRIAELFRLITRRKGVGEVLGQGIKHASEALGLEDLAIHVKGLEPAGFDPRVLKGMGLSYATSARGACHLRGTFYKAELSGEMDKEQIAGKARLLVDYEDRATIFDSLILCRFFRDFILWDELLQIVEAATGMKLSKKGLQDLANSITSRTRAYNRQEGLGPATDTLPKRFLEEPTTEGARLTADQLAVMLAEYNAIRARAKTQDSGSTRRQSTTNEEPNGGGHD
jgi:aldehyde:ferredoxin oxidoreductase